MGNCKSTPIRPPADERNFLLSPHQLKNASDTQPAGLDNDVVVDPVGAKTIDKGTDDGEAISATNNSLSRISRSTSTRDGSISSTAAVIFSRKSSKGPEKHEKSNGTLDVSSNSNSYALKTHTPKQHHNNHHHHTKQVVQQDPEWAQLFQTLSPYLLDPEDLPSTLDSIIARMINRLSPVEISFIRRRVRDASMAILNSNDGGGGDGNSSGGVGGGGGSLSRPTFSGHMAKVGRLVGAVSSNHVGNNSSHHDKSSSSSFMSPSSFHPALDEGHGKSASKALFQKEKLLDITMVRKVFENGERRLKALQQAGGIGFNTKPEFVDEIISPTAATTDGTDEKVVEKEKKSSKRKSITKTPSVQTQEETAMFPPKPEDLDRMALEKIDVYGSAFVLLIYMSEKRWDYVTEIAKLSAKAAGLTMDVNKLIMDDDKGTLKDGNSTTINGSRNGEKPFSSQTIPPPPLPPSFTPPSERFNLPELTLNEPGGVHFTSLCYLVAVALRGTRRQRLHLLFFLLLPHKILGALLASHAAGGLPTWLLEVDGDEEVVLSVDSLSYYYWYEGVLIPEFRHLKSRENDDSASEDLELKEKSNISNLKKSLAVDAKSAVEILATLLSDSFDDGALDSSFSSERGATKEKVRRRASDYGTRGLSKLLKSTDKEKEDDPAPNVDSQPSTNSLGVNEMLQLGWMKNTCPHEMERISNFLSVSSVLLDDSSTPLDSLSLEVGRKVWSINDFISWANKAIDDWVLDSIMRRLFSTGILPCAKIERKLVIQRWLDWNFEDSDDFNSESDKGETMSQARGGLRKMFGHHSAEYVQEPRTLYSSGLNPIFGGIGGADGKGGLGNGVLYCIDKLWWDDWVAYTGWQFGRREEVCVPTTLKRPRELSTERLLDRSPEAAFVSGTKGSYELMKSGMQLGIDYVLIPPGVWNVLYEMYGGGPPLPRMVLPNENNETNTNEAVKGVVSVEDECVEIVSPEIQEPTDIDAQCPVAIPHTIRVVTHPWVLHCQICDPQQPYRRGDAGPMSIRIMATPDQPLWRLFSEIVVRLPISHSKARDNQGEGRARLWKFDFVYGKAPSATGRYGPWSLLCKNRQTEIPITVPMSEKYEERWRTYADQHSVESIGLSDGMRIMYEYSILNKDGSFSWPREAAAKATRLSRIADEDAAFRCFLRGVDTEGKPLTVPILKKLVDAMDTNGRWYQAVIINTSTKTTLPEDLDGDAAACEPDIKMQDGNCGVDSAFVENTFVHVHFNDHAGDHEEWIDVKSDRLAVAGRFTADSVQNIESDADGDDAPNESKSRSGANKKKDGGDSNGHDSNGNLLCLFPSYGACGLHNLGNTCYANSGWQCISYLPLLRSYLLSGQFKVSGDLNKDNPLGTGGKLLEEFSELLRLMWSGKYGSRAPQKFRNFIGKCRPQYSGADQQDAQELLNDMIDMLHEDGNRVRKKPYVEALEDKWVEKTNLSRVGHEAWRRFLRRNRSAISDLAMGQVYNRVTCPVCNHSSKNFDPFNMLSLPFPTVAEVIFQCTVVRRATAVNCPGTLLWVGRQHQPKHKQAIPGDSSPPSKHLVFEQYIIPMSRLADMGDLKMKLQNVSGIPANRFRVCKKEDIVTGCGEGENIATLSYTRVSALPDKDGPCVKLLQQSSMDDITSPMIAEIVAFELTLNLRPTIQVPEDSAVSSSEISNAEAANGEESTADEMSDDSIDEGSGEEQNKLLEKSAREVLKVYGDEEECVVFDTNPTPLSKYVSRSLWPKTAKEFKLGLRVDAYDQRNHWFPGSVIEIINENAGGVANGENNDDVASSIKVRVHFDNFSSKWDEVHSIDSFNNGRVCPLYSHASPRSKPTEFVVHHRSIDRTTKKFYLFGQSFYLQCHNEWSTARAGAHILAQASRFLESSHFLPSENGKLTEADSKISDKERQEARKVIASIVEELIKHDKNYIESAIASREESKNKENQTHFDAAAMSSMLSQNLSKVLPLLPFDVRVTTADSPLGTNKEETPFPFSLVRTIGNYMNARHSLVLHWREKPDSTKNFKLSKKQTLDIPRQLLYVPPFVVAHKQSHDTLNKSVNPDGTPKAVRRHPSSAHGGMHIGVCLTEFCKEQQLDATDCWRCPVCRVNREGKQSMALWNLPDLLTFHLKRFNASSRWREKITTKVDFPLTGLNMRQWCDPESPLFGENDNISFIYDLVGVINHYGGMTGGHYVATCKATPCSCDGSEEIAYSFNGAGINELDTIEEGSTTSGWRLNRSKDKDISSNAAAKAASESSEPLWLQFDDDLVEPLPPRNVVSETAYVLFYRRRRMHPANIAKYSSLD